MERPKETPKERPKETPMTAEQILKAIECMDYDERIKLLIALGEKHFGRKPKTIEEVTKLNYEAFHGDDNEGF